MFKCKNVLKGSVKLSCMFEICGKGEEWAFSGVYCRGNGLERRLLWEELEACLNNWGGKWVIGEDFNMVLSIGEGSRNDNFNGEVEEFKDFVDMLYLVDLPQMGGK